MRVLVTGGRDYSDAGLVNAALDKFQQDFGVTVLIHGAATGADTLAANWAAANAIPQLPFKVTRDDWNRLGRRAGPLRNQEMLLKGRPNVVLAFPGGRGTSNMVSLAKAAGVPVESYASYAARSQSDRGAK